MEFLIVFGLIACIMCPVLIIFVVLGLIFYAMFKVMGIALFLPIIGLVVAAWVGSLFNPAIENARKDYKKACKDYNDTVFRWDHPDEYWEQKKRKQKKPSAETIKKCQRILKDADKREKSKLPIAKNYVNRWK